MRQDFALSRLLFGVAIFFTLFGTAQAESVRIFGVDFAVEELRNIDPQQVELSIAGETVLVPKDKLNDHIVSYYLGNKSRASSFSTESLREFVIAAMEAGAIQSSASALRAYASHSLVTEELVRDLLERVRDNNVATRVFQLVVESEDVIVFNQTITAELIFDCGLSDLGWIETLPRRYVLLLGDQVWQVFTQRMAGAFSGEQEDNFEQQIKVVQAFFRADAQRLDRISKLSRDISKAKQLVIRGDLETFNQLIDPSLGDKELQQVLAPLFVKALHQVARDKLSGGDPLGALAILAKIDFKRRTPTTHKLIATSLQTIGGEFASANHDLKIQLLLRSVAKKDTEVARIYLGGLEQLFREALSKYDTQLADDILEDILELRSDPNSANDQLRIEFIMAYLAAGHFVLAKSRLSEVTTELPLRLRLKLALSGLYVDQRLIFVAIAVIILALLLFMVRRRRTGVSPENYAAPEPSTDSSGKFSQGSRGRQGLYRYALNERQRKEYLAALQLLGLPPEASFDEIKAAFRNAVKVNHPDANPGADAVASDKFLSLTAAYETLMSMEKERDEIETADTEDVKD